MQDIKKQLERKKIGIRRTRKRKRPSIPSIEPPLLLFREKKQKSENLNLLSLDSLNSQLQYLADLDLPDTFSNLIQVRQEYCDPPVHPLVHPQVSASKKSPWSLVLVCVGDGLGHRNQDTIGIQSTRIMEK